MDSLKLVDYLLEQVDKPWKNYYLNDSNAMQHRASAKFSSNQP